jgi:DNA polymerase III alpha subunit
MPDIDIDFYDRNKVLELVPHHVAMRNQKGEEVKHNTGVYFTEIPHNPFTNLSTIDYEEAEKRGYFKVDFLNVSMYQDIRDEEHLISLLKDPDWNLLTYKEIVDQLFHINNHFDIVNKLKPTSIEQLAAVLAIIRPAKRYLVDADWATINKEDWTKTDEGYFFKKSHAVAYAHAIVVQLNALCERAEQNDA